MGLLSTPTSSARIPHARSRRGLLQIVVLAVLLVLGIKGWRLYSRTQALRQDAQAIEALAAARPDTSALASLGPLLARTHDDAVALHAEAAPLLPIARWLGWIPTYGPDIAAAEPILDLAVDLSSAADESFVALSPLLLERNQTQPIGVALVGRLAASRQQLDAVRQAIARADDAWRRIPIDRLTPSLHDQLARVEPLLPVAQDGIDMALALPDLMGMNGRRDYLVIAQNPDELRATGGLITAAGTLTFDSGRLVDVSIADSSTVDNVGEQIYPDPPTPLRTYMGMEMWVFRDSNWSPDFPTSAQAAMDLYKLGQGRDVAGVIALDPTAIELLLGAVGAVSVEGSPIPISAENVVAYMRDGAQPTDVGSQATPWAARRKTFLGPLAKALIAALSGDAANLDIIGLARAGQRAFDGRHVLVYLKQTSAAAALARRGWDGAVRPGIHDFLMVVDSNLGYNKVNPNIDETLSYSVDLSNPPVPVADLALRYTHRLSGPAGCDQAQGYQTVWQIKRYEDWMVGCYWDYLRVLIPRGSQLISATAQPVPGAWMDTGVGDEGTAKLTKGEAGTSALSTFLVVPLGGEQQKAFRYRLPPTVLAQEAQVWRYHLTLQKQPGINSLPVVVSVRLPSNAALISTSIPPTTKAEQRVSFTFDLASDQRIEVAFRMP